MYPLRVTFDSVSFSRSPGHRVPWWVLIWIKRSPLVFLVLSVACFSMGLVLFTYSSHQHRITSTVTTVFSAFSCFGLTAVSFWFASERWAFTRHKGEKWLADILSETKVSMHGLPGVAWCIREPRQFARKVAYYGRRHFRDLSDYFSGAVQWVSAKLKLNTRRAEDIESSEGSETKTPASPQYYPGTPLSMREHRGSDATATVLTPISERAPSTVDGHDDPTVVSDAGHSTPSSPILTSPAKTRFHNLVRSVIMLRSVSGGSSAVSSPRRQRTISSEKHGKLTEPTGMVRGSRVASLIPKLKLMESYFDLAAHQALVRHLQFSPDGKYLATSRHVMITKPQRRVLTLLRLAGIGHRSSSELGCVSSIDDRRRLA